MMALSCVYLVVNLTMGLDGLSCVYLVVNLTMGHDGLVMCVPGS